jgi:hypothetical protein
VLDDWQSSSTAIYRYLTTGRRESSAVAMPDGGESSNTKFGINWQWESMEEGDWMKSLPRRYYVQPHQWQGILLLVLVLSGPTTVADPGKAPRLALLVAAPWEGETAMHNDLVALYNALRQRGFAPEEFLILEGSLTRSVLLAFLHDVQRRLGVWQRGDVWFSFSGHGTLRGTTAAEAQPGLLLTSSLHPSQEEQVWWDEVFAALQVPAAVQLTLLPDS